MDVTLLLKALIAIAPVITLLLVFDRLDIFDLVSFREIVLLLLAGGLIAVLGLITNTRALDGFPIGFSAYTRYVSPVIEEILKAAPVIALFAVNRLGFKLDSAIAGFAVGAGFSVTENAWFLYLLGDANISAWIVRGFGTAVMHGGATAMFAVISHEFSEHQAEANAARYRFNPLVFVPGLIVAIVAHSAFNHFPSQPIVAMALTLLMVPMTLFVVFSKSEIATHRWLQADHDLHVSLLAALRDGSLAATEQGRAVAHQAGMNGREASDLFAHMALTVELVLRAEEIMLSVQKGKALAAVESEGLAEKFAALDALESRLGWQLANESRRMASVTRNDLWELGRLRARVRRGRRG